jgi:rod shape-determining protein MreD
VRAPAVILATVAALVLQSTLARFVEGTVPVDFILVAAVLAGLKSGPIAGLLTGTTGGLIQDAMASGVIGIGAWAKTVVGFLAGVVATQFIVAKPLPRFVVFAAATLLHAVVFMGLYEALGLRDFGAPAGTVAVQAAANAVVGVAALQAVELLPGAADRRRTARARSRR